MALIRYGGLPSMWREFDELFQSLGPEAGNGSSQERTLVPAADVLETPKAVEIHLDMPGVTPDAIEVNLEGHVLTVSAARTNEKTEEKQGYVRKERSWGKFVRSFDLPTTLDGTKPEATYRNGVLVVTLPKREEVLPRTVKVKVEA